LTPIADCHISFRLSPLIDAEYFLRFFAFRRWPFSSFLGRQDTTLFSLLSFLSSSLLVHFSRHIFAAAVTFIYAAGKIGGVRDMPRRRRRFAGRRRPVFTPYARY